MIRSSTVLSVLVVVVPYALFVHTFNGAAKEALHDATELLKGTAATGADLAILQAKAAEFRAAAAWHKQTVYLVNMSLMFLGLYVGVGPYVGNALDRGIVEVSEQLEVAERRSAKAKGELVDAEERLGKIDDDVAALRERERAAARTEADRMVDFAKKEATQIGEHAELSVKREAKDVRADLLAKIAGRAVDEALEGLDGKMDEATRTHIHRVMVEGVGA